MAAKTAPVKSDHSIVAAKVSESPSIDLIDPYEKLIASKRVFAPYRGFEPTEIHPRLFPFQRAVATEAARKGRLLVGLATGLGKSDIALELARQCNHHTQGRALILTHLGIAGQFVEEGEKMGIPVSRSLKSGSVVAYNYDRLSEIDPREFTSIHLDEGSILKDATGATRNRLIEMFSEVPYRFTYSATPSPNDHTELGNQAEFLGIMTMTQMLSRWFVHDSSDTSIWRLKGHARKEYWEWVRSWAICIRTPSDLKDGNGVPFSDEGYILPPLTIVKHIVECDPPDGQLFHMDRLSATDSHKSLRKSATIRAQEAARIAGECPCVPWLHWVNTDYEAEAMRESLSGVGEVSGKMKPETKEKGLLGFPKGDPFNLLTKPSIAGMGLNFQHCSHMTIGPSYSFEQMYQCMRRCWRYGQTSEVFAHVIASESEWSLVESVHKKQELHEQMIEEMISLMGDGKEKPVVTSTGDDAHGENWNLLRGDFVRRMRGIPSEIVGYSVCSPPFESLYTYSDLPEDLGNCKDSEEFQRQLQFGCDELFRIMMPGRLVSMHCMDLPMTKERDGLIKLRDFPSVVRQTLENSGFHYHSKVCIWKDPVTAMQRTKAIGLLHKQIKKDSARSRQGIADYVVTVFKPGDNPVPISHDAEDFPVSLWQRYASPVWMDIKQGDVLKFKGARAEKDERHICPLQREVIKRLLFLWSAPGDIVFDPFAGIGSTGVEALAMGRKFIGTELKESYFNQAKLNLAGALELANTPVLDMEYEGIEDS